MMMHYWIVSSIILEEMQYPLDYQLIQQNQFDDEQLQQFRQQYPQEYPVMDMGNDVQLICQVRPDRPWCICIPTIMVNDIICWYHLVLGLEDINGHIWGGHYKIPKKNRGHTRECQNGTHEFQCVSPQFVVCKTIRKAIKH